MKALKDQQLPLSVIVPVYNVETYLRRCLDSILHQTQPVQEIICVDDGSTDRSLAVLQEYERANEQIRVVHKENGGLVSARKAGLALAACPYATYVDSDDFIEPEMYEELMQPLLENDADVVTSGTIRDYGTHIVHAKETMEAGLYVDARRETLLGNLISTKKFFQMNLTMHLVEKIYRTELLRRFQNGLDERISVGEDAAVAWPLLLHAKRIYVSGNEYYHYCMRNDSIMGVKQKSDAMQLNAYFATLEQRLREVEGEFPNIMKQFAFMKTYVLLLRNAEAFLYPQGDLLDPFGEVPRNARIALYGAGRFGVELKAWLDRHHYHVALWVDKAKNRADIQNPVVLKHASYDLVLVAALQADAAASIEASLQVLGVPHEKVRKIEAAALKRRLGRNEGSGTA